MLQIFIFALLFVNFILMLVNQYAKLNEKQKKIGKIAQYVIMVVGIILSVISIITVTG